MDVRGPLARDLALRAKAEEFYNKSHDEKGRFAPGPFAGLKDPGGGATVDPATGKHVTEGYAVSLEGHSSVTPVKEFFSGRPPKGAKILADWIKNAKATGLLDKPEIKIGLWHDPESQKIFIDASEQVMDRAKAVNLGKKRDQIGIYHLAPNGEGYIHIGGSGGI